MADEEEVIRFRFSGSYLKRANLDLQDIPFNTEEQTVVCPLYKTIIKLGAGGMTNYDNHRDSPKCQAAKRAMERRVLMQLLHIYPQKNREIISIYF